MFLIIGTVVVLASVFGGYIAQGGHMDVLWQPFELVIIMGAAIGAYIITNPKTVLGAIPEELRISACQVLSGRLMSRVLAPQQVKKQFPNIVEATP